MNKIDRCKNCTCSGVPRVNEVIGLFQVVCESSGKHTEFYWNIESAILAWNIEERSI